MIFVCTHKEKPVYTLDCEYQIVTPDFSTNLNNIWNKVEYRHLRHIYFIYNNLHLYDYPETITIFQHRRYMTVLDLPEGYDIVCPAWPRNPATVYYQYVLCHDKESIDLSKQVINEYNYLEFLKTPMGGKAYHNIFTMRTEDFLEYCDDLFYILFEIEKRLPDFKNACFLGERIGAYLIWKNFNNKLVSPLVEI